MTFNRVELPGTLGLPRARFGQVSCTVYHALAVTTGGALFSWGWGGSGQLGNGSTEDDVVPQLVQAFEGVPIASAAAGCNTSLALAHSGEMWSWGRGRALGHGGDASSQELLPKVVEGLPPGAPVFRIATGGNTAACVRTDGTTLSWGNFYYTGAMETNAPTQLGQLT